MRWREVTGETIAPVGAIEQTGGLEVQIVRTIPEDIYAAVPRGDSGSSSPTSVRSGAHDD